MPRCPTCGYVYRICTYAIYTSRCPSCGAKNEITECEKCGQRTFKPDKLCIRCIKRLEKFAKEEAKKLKEKYGFDRPILVVK